MYGSVTLSVRVARVFLCVMLISALTFLAKAQSSVVCSYDSVYSHFSQGSGDSKIEVSSTGAGSVKLTPTLFQDFNGNSTPTGWTDAIWDNQAGASVTYSGGTLTVNGAHAYTNNTYSPGVTLAFEATFTQGNFQNIGFSADGNFNSPWVVIGRGNPGDGQVYARASNGQTVALGSFTNASHVYKIQWNSGTHNFQFYVDGNLISTPGLTFTTSTPMLLHVSDYPAGGVSLSVNWVRVTPYASPGVYTSRIFDAGFVTTWHEIEWQAETPAGTGVSMEVRYGNTPTPDGSWSTFTSKTNGQDINKHAQYLQYRATLTANGHVTPALQHVTLFCSGDTFACNAPMVYIKPVRKNVCPAEAVQLIADSTDGTAPFEFVLNGVTYSGVQQGDTFASFAFNNYSIWDNNATPANPSVTDNVAIEVGVKFRSSVSGFITGIRFYKGLTNTGTHIGSLWTAGGTQLATATFTNETPSGWQEVTFSSPVAIDANTTYIASYYSQNGYFAINAGYFSGNGVTNGPLTALQAGVDGVNGVYMYGGGFPVNGNTANYWVDVLFAENLTNTFLVYELTSVTDADDCNNSGSPISSDTVYIQPIPDGTLSADSFVCAGQSIELTFNATHNASPFVLEVNNQTFTGVQSGVPFSVGTAAFQGSSISSLWDDNTVGGTLASPDYGPLEVGVKFRSNVDGQITGIRFYKTSLNTGTHIGNLWTGSGTLLATATFTNETATGWQQVDFSTPVSIQANTTYVASYFAPNGNYAFNGGYFTSSGYTNGPLTALQNGVDGGNGVYNYSGSSSFPSQSFNSSNYWVDVVFAHQSNYTFSLQNAMDVYGCGSVIEPESTVEIEVKKTDIAVMAVADASCFGSATGTVTVSGENGLSPYEYKTNNNSYQSQGLFENLAAGTYVLTVKDGNGCTADTTVFIDEPAELIASELHTDIFCFGDSSQVTITAVGGVGPYTGTGITTQAAGTQMYVVTDANGCAAEVTVVISQPDSLWVSYTNDLILCYGQSAGVTIAGNGGTPPYTNTGNFTQSAGTQTYWVTDDNGCTASVDVLLTEPDSLRVSDNYTTILCNGGSATVTVNATGGTLPYTGAGNFTLYAGTQYYAVTDSNGCETGIDVHITEPSALIADTSYQPVLCFGGSTQVEVTASGGVSPYTGTGLFTQSAGTETYIITDDNGCSTQLTVTLQQPDALIVYESHTDILCFGETSTVTITALGGTPVYQGTGTFMQAAGSQQYMVTDANGCSANVTAVVTQPDAITATISAPAAVCPGNTLPLVLESTTGIQAVSVTVNGQTYSNRYAGDTLATLVPYETSIWGTSGTPTYTNGNDGQPIETGVKFTSTVNGYVTGARFFKGVSNTGANIGKLYASDGTLLASATYTNETASGWQEVRFSSPVPVQANFVYIISRYSADGYYAGSVNYFASSGVTTGPLTALQNGVAGVNGVYKYGGGFPDNSFSASNYWVDVLFTESNNYSDITYQLTHVTDSLGCHVHGTPIQSVTVDISPVPSGTISAPAAVCAGTPMEITFTPSAGTSPFSLTVNDSIYNNVPESVPYVVGLVPQPEPSRSIWSPNTIGGEPVSYDDNPVELGVKFRTSTDGFITGVRFYKRVSQTGTHTGRLWNGNGTLLATVTFTNETASGWQQALFDVPVAVQANTTYVVSYHAPNGNYAFSANYFTGNNVANGPLTALASGVDGLNGVYRYGSGGVYPNDSYLNANYWVDVVFSYGNQIFYDLTNVVDANGCKAKVYSVASTFVDTTIIADAGPAGLIAVCDGVSTVSLQGNEAAPGNGIWQEVQGSGTLFTPTNSNEDAQAATTVKGLYQYRWKITNGTCVSQDDVYYYFNEPIVSDVALADCGFLHQDTVFVNVEYSGGKSPFWVSSPTGDVLLADIQDGFKVYGLVADGLQRQYTVTDSVGCSVTSTLYAPANAPVDIPLVSGAGGFTTSDCRSVGYNKWLTFKDADNKAVVSINDNGVDLGIVLATVYRDSDEPTITTTGATCAGFGFKALKRHYVLQSDAPQPFADKVKVRLYFTEAELQSLMNAALSNDVPGDKCTYDDNIVSIADLFVTKYSGPDEDGDYSNNSATGIYKVYGNGSMPVPTQGSLNSSQNGFATFFNGGANHHYVELQVDEFSEFWIHGSSHGSPLPVQLIMFEAKPVDNRFIQLNWSTAIEVNNDGFSVERSINGSDWEAIGWVKGNQNSTVVNVYQFNDLNAQPGVRYYYRLKQLDLDGNFEYSQVVSAVLRAVEAVNVLYIAPNPASNLTTVAVNCMEDTDVKTEVVNVLGEVVLSKFSRMQKGQSKLAIDVSLLDAGTYTIVLKSNAGNWSKKLVVVH